MISQQLLPNFIVNICGLGALIAIIISLIGINLQFLNYRKPFEQRLIVRIQLMVPLYAICCYVSIRWFTLSKIFEPIKEIYEAFVIYTFFSLLTHLLGGERNIVITTSGREPISHPWPLKRVLPNVDVSDPFTLLAIKRGILQYVWLKPIICGLAAINEGLRLGQESQKSVTNLSFIINFVYNISVTVSLYELALFWKCLYTDLKPFNPWGKFLCVKLIIFASYWQGVILGLLSWLEILKTEGSDTDNTLGFAIQNALLCIELIGFAIGHWYSFSWSEYSVTKLPGCGRLSYRAAMTDCFGIGDLIYDFKATISGDSYDYRKFDSVEALIAHPTSQSRMARINDGLRFTDSGRQKYWLPSTRYGSISLPNAASKSAQNKKRANSISSSHASVRAIYANSIITVNSKDEPEQNPGTNIDEDLQDFDLSEYVTDSTLYTNAKRERPYGDKNCPIIFDTEEYTHSPALQRLREQAMARQQAV